MNRRDVLIGSLATLSAGVTTPLFGQSRYPERPIKLLVAFSAGGVNDVVGRQWADRMKGPLGTVVVENQGGGSGTIARRRSFMPITYAVRSGKPRMNV